MSNPHRSFASADPRLAVLRAWLSVGVVLLILLPPSQWHNAAIGWLPYWLLVAPAISLALLRRRRLAAALAALLVRSRRRRNAWMRTPRRRMRVQRSAPRPLHSAGALMPR